MFEAVGKDLDVIIPSLSNVQAIFAEGNIPTLVGGEIATDLVAFKYIDGYRLRKHKDVEMLVPIAQRERFIQLLSCTGFDQDPTIHQDDIHFLTLKNDGIKYEVFFTCENKNDYTPLIFTNKRIDSSGDVCINPDPEIVTYQGYKLLVLTPESQLAIKKRFGLGNSKDTKLIERVIRLKG